MKKNWWTVGNYLETVSLRSHQEPKKSKEYPKIGAGWPRMRGTRTDIGNLERRMMQVAVSSTPWQPREQSVEIWRVPAVC